MREKLMDWTSAYQERLPVLASVAEEIRATLEELLCGVPRIDRITTRVKTIDSFVGKAQRIDPDAGKPRYTYPLEEIQDQIGARIVVFYRSLIDPVTEKVLTEIQEVENRLKEQPALSFGYEARHLVCFIPPDIRATHHPPIEVFELQISTLFQYAWSQAEHDVGYKPQGELSYDDRRRMAWAAAQAWGADVIFDELWNRFRPA
jgi:ppGpp synthetase/RelA/SpoT-type nucleotidyltranferase